EYDDDLHVESSFLYFFVSSRRRHTRCYRDWSSDVCSSDLASWDRPGACLPRSRLGRPGTTPQRGNSTCSQDAGLRWSLRFARIKIGRASCRERVEMWAGDGALGNEGDNMIAEIL